MSDKKATRTWLLKINEELCKGCRLCIEFCPKGVLDLSVKVNRKGNPFSKVVHAEKCIGCRACTLVCPDTCIELSEVEQEEQ